MTTDAKEYARRYYAKNREWLLAGPMRDQTLRKRYGITLAQWNEMFEKQQGRCASCGDLFTKTPDVDHNHTSGEARELVCRKCNIVIAALENPRRANCAAYLERHS